LLFIARIHGLVVLFSFGFFAALLEFPGQRMVKHRSLVPQGRAAAVAAGSMIKKDDVTPELVQTETTLPRPVKGLPTFRSRNVVSARTDEPPRSSARRGPMKSAGGNPDIAWSSLATISLDPAVVARHGLFPQAADHPVTAQFDILRTNMLQAMSEREWVRIAVTSPTHGCGKSLVAANLALAMARLPSVRTVLVDLELRGPELAHMFGADVGPLGEMLSGEQPIESHVRRLGDNLALALNNTAIRGAAESLLSPETAETLAVLEQTLQPNVMIFDMPPALGSDDVLSILPLVDAVLLVADGTRTTADDIRACSQLIEGRSSLLGVVLNRASDLGQGRYRYSKKQG
jgi:Mrp family chromosome partitioning ATPase